MEPRVLIELKDGDFSEITFLYAGDFHHAKWGHFKVTEKHLEEGLANFQKGVGALKDAGGSPVLACNYDHPSGLSTDPEQNKNSGIITKLFKQGKAIKALVKWTDKAKEYIKNKEFLWISPEFHENWKDENGKKHGFTFLGLALTNYPFLKKNQLALALTDDSRLIMEMGEEPEVNIMEEKIRELLELTEDDDILEAVSKLKEGLDSSKANETDLADQLKEAQKKLTEKDDDGDEPEDVVKLSKEEYDGLNSKVIDLEKRIALRDAEELVDSVIEEGKLLPAQKEQAVKMALKDSESFKALMENQKPVIDINPKGSANDSGLEGNAASKVDQAVKAKQKENPNMTYSEAVRIVLKENEELAKEYAKMTRG